MNQRQTPANEQFNEREKEILRILTCLGPSAAIGDSVGLSERQTRRLIRQMEARVGVNNTHALVAWAAVNLILD